MDCVTQTRPLVTVTPSTATPGSIDAPVSIPIARAKGAEAVPSNGTTRRGNVRAVMPPGSEYCLRSLNRVVVPSPHPMVWSSGVGVLRPSSAVEKSSGSKNRKP